VEDKRGVVVEVDAENRKRIENMQHNAQEFGTAGPQRGTTSDVQEKEGQIAELQFQLESEQAKSEEYLDLLRRTQADFVNYKRRAGQEQQEGKLAAQAEVLNKLLPVLDDLGRALQATPPELANSSWAQGILLVARRLMSTLEQMGVRQIGTPGEQFDPRIHEALGSQPNSGRPEGTILQVTRPGYVLGDRVIRPAQVIVAGQG
jgi:molecular chaperone GrpE